MGDAALMEAALAAAEAAGAVALRHWRGGLAVERKADGSPVTAADRQAEQAARDWIGARFPTDGILGEELGVLRPEAPRRWVIDPIDGTITFVRGVPLWGSLVAVVEGERVLAGAAVFPAVGERHRCQIGADLSTHAQKLSSNINVAPGGSQCIYGTV